MESRVKLLGHPVHPMIVVFPVGLLITAVVLDLISVWRGAPSLASIAHFNMGIGVIMGLVAAVFGWIDWFGIPEHTRAKRIGLIHGVGNMMAVVLFAAVWVMRRDETLTVLPTSLLSIELAAFAMLAVGGWLGGELVDRLGVGVDDGANVNAPNSLRVRRPA